MRPDRGDHAVAMCRPERGRDLPEEEREALAQWEETRAITPG
jgi:hypothetical protein